MPPWVTQATKRWTCPPDPQAFVLEIEKLLGSTSQLNTAHANPVEWNSAAFFVPAHQRRVARPGRRPTQPLAGRRRRAGASDRELRLYCARPETRQLVAHSLARLTRELNRLFPMPAVLLFRHPLADGTPLLSIAVIHRRANKVDATRDVIEGKVSIIKDIDLANPHAAHLRILESMALTEVDAQYVPSSFDALYKAWRSVLDVKALNERFYKDLAEWYYWAIRKGTGKETGVVFPKASRWNSQRTRRPTSVRRWP